MARPSKHSIVYCKIEDVRTAESFRGYDAPYDGLDFGWANVSACSHCIYLW
jgi:hypothetical protein